MSEQNPINFGTLKLKQYGTKKIAWDDNHSGPSLPKAPKDEFAYYRQFKTKIYDPYRPLEQSKNPEVIEWIRAHSDHAKMALGKDQIDLEEKDFDFTTCEWLGNLDGLHYPFTGYDPDNCILYESSELGRGSGNNRFINEKTKDNHKILFTSGSGEVELVLDQSELSVYGAKCTIDWCCPSPDSRYLAYAIITSVHPYKEGRIRDIKTKKDLSKRFNSNRFVGWHPSSKGIYYISSNSQTAESGQLRHDLRYHEIGTSSDEDAWLLRLYDEKKSLDAAQGVSIERYLPNGGIVFSVHFSNDVESIYTNFVSFPKEPCILYKAPQPDSSDFEKVIGLSGRSILMLLYNSKKYSLISIPVKAQSWNESKILIQTLPIQDMKDVIAINDILVVKTLEKLSNRIKFYSHEGELIHEFIPDERSAIDFHYIEPDNPTIEFLTSRYFKPQLLWQFNINERKATLRAEKPFKDDFKDIETYQDMAVSKDGTHIPLTIIHHKKLNYDGSNPTILHGYGGYNSGFAPEYNHFMSWWVKQGGVFAIAHLRGDGGWGDDWHAQGSGKNKKNTYNDFIACAERLHDIKITSPSKTAAHGISNGGLTVSSTMLMRPDLFGAVIADVPFTDIFSAEMITRENVKIEHGFPLDHEARQLILTYAPLYNVQKKGKYPPMLITCMGKDENVPPSHPLKLYATLKEKAHWGNTVYLYYKEYGAHSHLFLKKDYTDDYEAYGHIFGFLKKTIGTGDVSALG